MTFTLSQQKGSAPSKNDPVQECVVIINTLLLSSFWKEREQEFSFYNQQQ